MLSGCGFKQADRALAGVKAKAIVLTLAYSVWLCPNWWQQLWLGLDIHVIVCSSKGTPLATVVAVTVAANSDMALVNQNESDQK